MTSGISGSAELSSTLTYLGTKGIVRVATSMAKAANAVIAREMKKAAPRGETKQVVNDIGRRVVKSSKVGFVTAKSGIGVGKRKVPTSGKGKHSAVAAIGSKQRFRKRIGGKFDWVKNPTNRQLGTGRMPSNNFIDKAISTAKPAAVAAMTIAGQKALVREAARVAKRNK